MGYIHTKIDLASCELVADQYVSTELLQWLKNSCIKTKSGEDLICYHGSPSKEKFAIFNDSTVYGCKSFVGFFSLYRDFAECYTDDGEDTSYNRVRNFVINSKKLFDIKNPACQRFLVANLPDTVSCCGDNLDKVSFVKYLKTEQMQTKGYKLTLDRFQHLKMFDSISSTVLGDISWNHSCSLASEKGLNSKYFLNADFSSNSVLVLASNNRIKPKLDFSYFNKATNGIYLADLEIPFNKAVDTGILTAAHLTSLSQGKAVNIKLSAEEFINACSSWEIYGSSEISEKDRQKLRTMVHNPAYDNLDLSINVTLMPQNISLDEFNQGMEDKLTVKKVDSTWELYEDSYCLIDGQKTHILDWLKAEGFDAVVVKEDWAVNIICLYKNMIKDLSNQRPTDSDNVFEKYNYSDALLADLF